MPATLDLHNTGNLDLLLSDPDSGAAVTTNDLTCRVQPPAPAAAVDVVPVTLVSAGGPATPARYRARYASSASGEHWVQFKSATLGLEIEEPFMVRDSHVT